jgi:mevalonate kinase
MRKSKKHNIPDMSEFTDEEGKKWIQTSTEDLFSIKELNEVLESIDREGESGEIILARIDFQKVDKQYYEAAVELQKKLRRQSEVMKRFITEAKYKIDRKNKKLKELIDYIKKIHLLLARLGSDEEELKQLKIPMENLLRSLGDTTAEGEEPIQEYEEIEEVPLPLND